VVQEALRIGAHGYVVKTHAGIELLAGVEAVRQGKQFISGGVPRKTEITRSHEVQFYSDDASFLVGFTRYIEAAVKAGNAVIVVATESHRNSLFQRLEAQGLNIGAAIEQGSFIPLNVADTLSTFMVNGLIDPVRFAKVAGDLLVEAAKEEEHHHGALC
jgi:hypothetical protein